MPGGVRDTSRQGNTAMNGELGFAVSHRLTALEWIAAIEESRAKSRMLNVSICIVVPRFQTRE